MPSSSSASPAVALRRPGGSRTRGHPGVALVIMLSAQLMIILDMTVVNIALPHIQAGLHFSAAGLSWVLNAYTLTFGGLLLLGGRAGDILGRRRMFLAGIALFTVSSLAGGLATTAWWLLTARALQGVGGALASPAVLALVVGSFPEGRERTRALGIYSAVAMGGASLGLVLGGVITEWASWRWVLFINVPVGIAVIAITPLFITESPRQPGRFDVTGAVTSIAGMTALVYAFIRAASDGWSDRLTLAAFAVAAVMLAAFLLTESRARQPITPLRLFTSPARAGSYLARLLLVAGMFGMFFFLTQFVQDILGFSPLAAGFAFLPMTLTVFAVSRAAPRLLPRFGPTRLMLAGMLPVIGGMAWLAQVSTQTTYLGGVLGPMLLIGTGMGIVFVPLTMVSLAGVAPADSGAASSMVNVTQQVGGSLGLAILVTVFGTAYRNAARHLAPGVSQASAARQLLVHGMSAAFTVAVIFDACVLLVILLTSRTRPAPPVQAGTARPPGPGRSARHGDRADREPGRERRARGHDGGGAAVLPGCVGQGIGGGGHHGGALEQGQVKEDRVLADAAVRRRGQHHVAPGHRRGCGQPAQFRGELGVGHRSRLQPALRPGRVRQQAQVRGTAADRRPQPPGQQRPERHGARRLVEGDDLPHPRAVRRAERGGHQRLRR